jgi:hypothetical protein
MAESEKPDRSPPGSDLVKMRREYGPRPPLQARAPPHSRFQHPPRVPLR